MTPAPAPPTRRRGSEAAFVEMYFLCNMNAAEAYARLHSEAAPAASRSRGAAMLARPAVQALVNERLERLAMPKSEVLARLSVMARASSLPFIRTDSEGAVFFDFGNPAAQEYFYLIKKIKTKRTRRLEGRGEAAQPWEDEWVEVELHDAQAALEKLGRYYRLEKGPAEGTALGALPSLPAELISPSFFPVYRDLRAAAHSEYLLKGGRGSTKSSFTSLALIYLLVNHPRLHALALRQVANTLRDSVYTQLVWAIHALGLAEQFKCSATPLELEYLPTHQKIYFRGADKPEKIKSIKPAFGHIGLLWFEELDQFRGPEAVRSVEQSVLRGGDEAWVFKTYNPPRSSSAWANQYALLPKERQLQHHSTYLEAPADWLGRAFLDEAEFLRTANQRAYEHEYLGRVTGSGGLVFENVELREISAEEIAGFERPLRGIDWGYFPDPFSFGLMHYDAARLVLYIYGELRATRLGNRRLYEELAGAGLIDARGLIVADSAEPKSIADFREYGANIIGAEKGAESVAYSMKWLQSLAQIVIDPRRAPAHALEFSTYELEREREGAFISAYPDRDNHAIDDVRYATNLIWRRRGK